jgi:HD-like signal output (HDOD) protein
MIIDRKPHPRVTRVIVPKIEVAQLPDFGRRLRSFIRSRRIRYDDLAAQMGVHPPEISLMLYRDWVYDYRLIDLCHATDTTLEFWGAPPQLPTEEVGARLREVLKTRIAERVVRETSDDRKAGRVKRRRIRSKG